MAIKKAEGSPAPEQKPETITGSSTPTSAGVAQVDTGESFTQKCIRRSGLIQAASESPGVAAYSTNWEDYKTKVIELAEANLKWVETR